MLDIKFIRENLHLIKKSVQNRGMKLDIEKFALLDEKKRKTLIELESLRNKKNVANDEINKLLKDKKDHKPKIQEMKSVAQEIDKLEEEIKTIKSELDNLILNVPNMPHESVPVGGASANKVIKVWGNIKKAKFPLKTHDALCEKLDIIDFKRAAKITGSNFILFKGAGARLERALYNFMLDLHTKKHGYSEVFPPFLVNRASMIGTGQLPKLEEDMYRLKDDDLFLIPTAEVPVTNIFRDEVLDEKELPKYLTAYTACFRREAGSYGKNTKGLTRVHQFDKVELVKFVKPETSFDELEMLLKNAEKVLQLLNLSYRIVSLATGDISFAASKCYDIEAFAPGQDAWLEISSCSNFTDFQARRANIRYREKNSKETKFVHTLNGSGVALARTVICILENYQQKDGSIIIPKPLRRYMDGQKKIG